MPPKRQYNEVERASMAALAEHMSLREAGKQFGASPATVSYQLKKLAEYRATNPDPKSVPDGTFANKKRSGRPRTYSERDERTIVRIIRANRSLTMRQLLSVVETDFRKVSEGTLRRIMKEKGLQSTTRPKG